ncbi:MULTISPECIES: energy-coupling factor ABC transporter ATP-binding protein [Bacillaceae]|jgi:energy-coupling factor transport system ATP-binding protein|uniref:Energy-coupling factor transporter ATP-binding protein EcfA2 n=1 Tax=Cytobacillus firmus TaxID=1399 RepID=A0AA46P2Z8_CYTFI|nr:MULTISPECIES: energy-coupling factor ABC transporter ATP-binding protein [Bacillaceae]KML36677.1 cobalt transporter ATP-binding subunit [Cytobacillus firmus]MCC3649713.1 energy-coupling factor ABC transporter ATP-binding protein [Cytobacillus oceanisediminis]UYG93334.1 energy-coupling factor ABC transporter ATP-binding protein [Cytobacillus firmus]WHY34390.1 energy-coupling factor ABC transporter ATP-binding protein [Cytobacillus firmus]
MDISLQNVEYRYQINTPFERLAIKDVSIDIPSGTFLAIIGHTGSGKSTVLQHLNALLKPTEGQVVIGNRMINPEKKQKNLKEIRQRVGIVFQFPEHQLFEETVEKDICFGPMNFGVTEEEAKKRARAAIGQVGLPEEILSKSPFDLSGGQMRRVAIAGVLAMEPDVIVLDEPTAGLDPRGRKEIMDMFYSLHGTRGLSTVLVTHSMEDASRYADQIVIMHNGEVYKKGTPEEIFSSPEGLLKLGLDVPEVVRFQLKMEKSLNVRLSRTCLTMDELTDEIAAVMKRGTAT